MGFENDRYYNNAYYAKVGGISTREMNFLEVDFLFGLAFELNVTPTTFHTYCCCLQREMLLLQQSPRVSLPDHHHHHYHHHSSLNSARSSKLIHLHFNEDHDTSHHKQQLAA